MMFVFISSSATKKVKPGSIGPAIQGFEVNGWSALLDSTTHFKGHTQEIVCLTRMQLGDDYRFHWQPTTKGWLQKCPACGQVPGISRRDLYAQADAALAEGERTITVPV